MKSPWRIMGWKKGVKSVYACAASVFLFRKKVCKDAASAPYQPEVQSRCRSLNNVWSGRRGQQELILPSLWHRLDMRREFSGGSPEGEEVAKRSNVKHILEDNVRHMQTKRGLLCPWDQERPNPPRSSLHPPKTLFGLRYCSQWLEGKHCPFRVWGCHDFLSPLVCKPCVYIWACGMWIRGNSSHSSPCPEDHTIWTGQAWKAGRVQLDLSNWAPVVDGVKPYWPSCVYAWHLGGDGRDLNTLIKERLKT